MKVRKYDLVFGLGASCWCSQGLRDLRLQHLSFPFDWTGDSTMRQKADMIASGFADWLNRDRLVVDARWNFHEHISYQDTKTGIVFAHDFRRGRSTDEEFEAMSRKYQRRINRFLGILSRSKRVLVFWLGDFRFANRIDIGDVRYVLDVLSRRYPQVSFEMIALDHAEGVSYENRRSAECPGGTLTAFDYSLPSDEKGPWCDLRRELVLPFLQDVRVRDYRTADEKRAFRRRQREHKYALVGAHSPFSYFWLRLQVRLYKHLKKSLERKGACLG